jgi:hypothetical protein
MFCEICSFRNREWFLVKVAKVQYKWINSCRDGALITAATAISEVEVAVQLCGEGRCTGSAISCTGSGSGGSDVRGSCKCGDSGNIAVAMTAILVAVSSAAVKSEAAVKVAGAQRRKWKRRHWMRRKKDWKI